jgi:protein tyrosine phosphatase (PTP) superfamily phosphohydrolase (DUF442 family)
LIMNFTIMMMIGLVLLWTSIYTVAEFNPYSLSKLNSFSKTPLITDFIQIGGRLIERHISYLAEAGFKSLLSVVSFPSNDTIYNGVDGTFPSSDYEMTLAQTYGLSSKYVASSFTIDSAKTISDMISKFPKPLYVHCHVGFTASLFVQLHLYLQGEALASDIYPNGLQLGYDYQNVSDVVTLINSLTGRNDSTAPERIEQSLASGEYSYKYYYWTHRLGSSDSWFNAGQFLDTHLGAIVTTGLKTVVSFRDDAEPTAHLPGESGAVDNHEFSDANGLYSVNLEAVSVKAVGLDFLHLPVIGGSASSWSVETFQQYYPQLRKAEQRGPVLIHCASGYRSAAFVLTYLAYNAHMCSDWVLLKARQVGFDYHSPVPTSSDLQVLDFIFAVLQC